MSRAGKSQRIPSKRKTAPCLVPDYPWWRMVCEVAGLHLSDSERPFTHFDAVYISYAHPPLNLFCSVLPLAAGAS